MKWLLNFAVKCNHLTLWSAAKVILNKKKKTCGILSFVASKDAISTLALVVLILVGQRLVFGVWILNSWWSVCFRSLHSFSYLIIVTSSNCTDILLLYSSLEVSQAWGGCWFSPESGFRSWAGFLLRCQGSGAWTLHSASTCTVAIPSQWPSSIVQSSFWLVIGTCPSSICGPSAPPCYFLPASLSESRSATFHGRPRVFSLG
jgi:hypothetical protein